MWIRCYSAPSSGVVAMMTLWLMLVMPSIQAATFSDPSISYCKCICFSNSTIIPLFRPENPSKPCLSCTRQFCLDQKLPICRNAEVPELDTDVGTGLEGDVEARCFKRGSPRDQFIVTIFCLIVVGLLLTAAIRSRLRKAIDARGRPGDLREWGQALLPTQIRQNVFPGRREGQEGYLARSEMRDMSGAGSGGGRGYAPVSVGS